MPVWWSTFNDFTSLEFSEEQLGEFVKEKYGEKTKSVKVTVARFRGGGSGGTMASVRGSAWVRARVRKFENVGTTSGRVVGWAME